MATKGLALELRSPAIARVCSARRPWDLRHRIVTPLLDRLLHHGHLLKLEGKSWRLKESAARLAKAARPT